MLSEVSAETLTRYVLKRFVGMSLRGRMARYKEALLGKHDCPFYNNGKCENPLNPSGQCTEEPDKCEHINKILGISHPMPMFLVPVRSMLIKGYIKIFIEENNIIVVPTKHIYVSYANRAERLIKMAITIYGNPSKRNVMIMYDPKFVSA